MNTHSSPLLARAVAVFCAIQSSLALAQSAEGPDPYKNVAQSKPANPGRSSPVCVSILEETFSLPTSKAAALLRATTTDEERYRTLCKMIDEGTAQLDRLATLRTRSSHKATAENIRELRYATEFVAPSSDPNDKKKVPATKPGETHPDSVASAPPMPGSFDTRNTGDSLVVEATVGSGDRGIELNIETTEVRFAGENGPQAVPQPIFETSKLDTNVQVAPGKPYLLGALNRPSYLYPLKEGDDGKKENGEARTRLKFITVQVMSAETP